MINILEYGINLDVNFDSMEFIYKDNTFGPIMEKRKLDDVRKTLKDFNSKGPEILYSIAMDIGNKKDIDDLKSRNLLYGACIYSKGKVGDEPVRSQGHIHAISRSCNMSTPEMYEIWFGDAYIFMQPNANKNVGKAYAIKCTQGDKVIVPPGFAHYTLNANPNEYMVFGAWCVRDFGFDYKDVRSMGGLSYFPIADDNGQISFIHNDNYDKTELIIKTPRQYTEFNLQPNTPIYTEYEKDKNKFQFVTDPGLYNNLWENFIP